MKKAISCLLIVALLGVVFQPFALSIKSFAANEKSSSYRRGKEDGRKAANKDTKSVWSILDFAYGFTLGPIAVGHSLISDYILSFSEAPEKRKKQIYSRDKDYQRGYKEGYLNIKSRNKLAIRTTGWLSWIGSWAIIDQMRQ